MPTQEEMQKKAEQNRMQAIADRCGEAANQAVEEMLGNIKDWNDNAAVNEARQDGLDVLTGCLAEAHKKKTGRVSGI